MTITILNTELEFDFFEAETAEKFEQAVGEVVKEADESQELNAAGMIRKQCQAVFKCFDTIFGENTHKQIFGEKMNLMDCLKAFEQLTTSVRKQEAQMTDMLNQYSPERAQRRRKK